MVLSGGGAKGLAHIGVLKVLEEAGIPVDYIGGTSMGSIVGGLYAIGYTPSELEKLSVSMNWDSLLTDKVSRRNLSIEEKDDIVRYFVSFPIRGKKIALPSGVIAGQNISALFNRLASPVYRENDFSKFPIPFICIGTDIENVESTVFRSGYLPQAMRASMAIPTVFAPEEIDGHLYVDGGVLNNFPVLDVKQMGADILIGSDVGFRDMSRKELGSLFGIVNQSMYALSKEAILKNKKECKILIEPDLNDYNMMNFNNADSIIARGERAARQFLPQLKALADSLARIEPFVKPMNNFTRFQSVDIREIEVEGLNYVPKEFVLRKLQLAVPSQVSLQELENSINLVYGTQFFDKITYQLVPLEQGTILKLLVSERSTNLFRVGIHYDSDFKTALLLNTTFRNLMVPGSKISLDVALGENFAFNGLLYLNTGWNPNRLRDGKRKIFPDFGIRTSTHNLEVYEYQEEKRVASYNFSDATADFFWQANLTNNTALGGGFIFDYSYIKNNVGVPGIPQSEFFFGNVHLYYLLDTYNKAFYPSRGAKLQVEAKYVTELAEGEINYNDFLQASSRFSFAFPISKRLTGTCHMFLGTSSGNSVPYHYRYYFGGLGGTNLRGLYPFVGLKYMQETGLSAMALGTNLQWEMWDNNFLTAKFNVGRAVVTRKSLMELNEITYGGGLSYGYNSAIGPMEITFMVSNRLESIGGFINIGYWF